MPSEENAREEARQARQERNELRAEVNEQKAKTEAADILKNRVALAAVVFTTVLTFINNVKSERQSVGNGAKEAAATARARAGELWMFFQTKLTERTSLEIARDSLQVDLRRMTPTATADHADPLAAMKLADYDEHIHGFDRQAQEVFFRIQELERTEDLQNRARFEPQRAFTRYDLASKIITLALILLSVTILAGRHWLLIVGIILGAVGVIVGVDGYLLLL